MHGMRGFSGARDERSTQSNYCVHYKLRLTRIRQSNWHLGLGVSTNIGCLSWSKREFILTPFFLSSYTYIRYEGVVAPHLPEELLKKLLYKATSEVEFSFDGQLYRQTDGVAMGSPLGPVLANIFMGYLESSIPKDEFPLLYNRFVDDTFAIFSDTTSVDTFFESWIHCIQM